MVNKLGYKSEVYVINKKNIKDFVLLKSKRKPRENKISQIKKILLAGEHFDSPLVVNQKNGSEKRMIDGMHRLTAITGVIDKDPNFDIEVLLAIYKNLTPKQEREIFRKWNIGTAQSSDDFIQIHEDEIPILKKLSKNFVCPVSIYKEHGKLHFKLLVGSYIAAKQNREGGYSLSNKSFVDECKTLDDSDYDNMVNFVQEFMDNTNGSLDRSNLYLNTTPFAALLYLYYHNVVKKKLAAPDFWARFRAKVVGDPTINQMSMAGGITATTMVQNLMIANMNRVAEGKKLLRIPYDPHKVAEKDESDESDTEDSDKIE